MNNQTQTLSYNNLTNNNLTNNNLTNNNLTNKGTLTNLSIGLFITQHTLYNISPDY